VVDLDLEKFFDRVNHDKLMAKIANKVGDKRMLKLIRAFLTAGVMEDGLVNPVDESTPQGGPLSPLLSNIVLDEMDRELERRELRFARYGDDCNLYVRSPRAGERVMASITRFLSKRSVDPGCPGNMPPNEAPDSAWGRLPQQKTPPSEVVAEPVKPAATGREK